MAVFIEEIVFVGEVAAPESPARTERRREARERADRDTLIAAAVAEVMRILRRERER